MYYSNYTKFIKPYYYSSNLLFKRKPQSFQCLKNYRSYNNLKSDMLQPVHIPKPATCDVMKPGT